MVDITNELHPLGGKENVVEYIGLFKDATPDPNLQPGFIMMQSHVVFERRHILQTQSLSRW